MEVVYTKTQSLDIQSILAMQQYKAEELNVLLFLWNNELQAIVNASQCGDYVRIMYRKPK